ncbi:tetratricopeptide repeat protein 39B-like [Pecten maximus]|uniref:tetratricopeptide repeat protein 39B-like n=2 Tax=Pecten maximus TaxID=6579 RepID=UPI001457F21E|nr:tetratricopeptide repeat protein 39B-like [Pecten maximus]
MASNVVSSTTSAEEDDEEFEDAVDVVQIPTPQDLASCLEQANLALTLFFNNKFSQARELLQPCVDWSMYHSLGYGTIMYLQAIMTFDMNDIEVAIQTIKSSLVVCNKYRRKVSMLEAITRSSSRNNYNDLSEVEIHAELCYAECLMIRALLTFVQDENLISFVKGGLKIRECYKVYKECNKMLKHRTFKEEKIHFESGVRMGVGGFNLMISLLPGKVLKLLEFVGFSGSKKVGLSELQKGTEVLSSLRGPLCSIILIAYHTVVCFVLGLADGDVGLADELLQNCLKRFPKGALFLFFAGRIAEVRGNIDTAICKFEESIECQQEWRQFHHLCFWELMWCYCFKSDWLMAMKYAEKLCKESRWSKATYTYLKACFLLMCEDRSQETQDHLVYLFGEVPKLKQRIAGKSIPLEKFAVHKAKRFQEEGNHLLLPALEMVYLLNGFNILSKNDPLLEPFLLITERTINEIVEKKDSHPCFMDDYCLALLLKGVCLKHRSQYFQARQCFTEIVANEKNIKKDTFLVPYAVVELAILNLAEENWNEVKLLLEKAKNKYKGYLLESRLHFRVHAVRLSMSNQTNSNNSNDGGDVDELESPLGSPQPGTSDKGGDRSSWTSGQDSLDAGVAETNHTTHF